MRFVIENGWRGEIAGLARIAALAPRGEKATLVVPRAASLRTPQRGEFFAAGEARWEVLSYSADATNITIECRRIADG